MISGYQSTSPKLNCVKLNVSYAFSKPEFESLTFHAECLSLFDDSLRNVIFQTLVLWFPAEDLFCSLSATTRIGTQQCRSVRNKAVEFFGTDLVHPFARDQIEVTSSDSYSSRNFAE
ncbi:hypothetical protein HG530_014928 [Fusarium avenaceum]|nr:hypothetical protein HG530_014928 [Fusarium avenaceum]